MKKLYFFSYLGGPGGALRRTQVNENFRALRPHNRADKFITREKNNHQFFIYPFDGHNVLKRTKISTSEKPTIPHGGTSDTFKTGTKI